MFADTDWNSFLETPPNSPYDYPYSENNDANNYFNNKFECSCCTLCAQNQQCSLPKISSNIQPTSLDSLNDLKISPFPLGIGAINQNGEFESRVIQVSNLPTNVSTDELQKAFSPFGDIEKIDTSDLSKEIVRIHFYDIRSAQWAKISELRIRSKLVFKTYVQNQEVSNPSKPPNNGTIVIFHLPKFITEQEIYNIFSQFGEIRQIRSTPLKQNQKFVEFFDVRCAENALKSMNGKLIKNSRVSIEFSLPGGFRKNGSYYNRY